MGNSGSTQYIGLSTLMNDSDMPGPETRQTTMTRFAFSDTADGYVLTLVTEGSEAPVLNVTLNQDLVESSVLQKAVLALELRPDGSVVAYTDAREAADLAAVPLADLVSDALAVADADDADLLAELEATLRKALETTQATRARLSSS